ncbi:hypothetical protein RSOL_069900 [Rhizoctonia solani AG-3 Rhs1AP]|uniref:Uncharacterized protein n=1 Tax=Rhizoctonia solani AG-3 Rhs1AP TaxID=1086054 RepID=X8IY88_9AGAM|nr:hypothetical protein RSOL_069900 [Rhizoctonia solani AG-3 Rhs1AP]
MQRFLLPNGSYISRTRQWFDQLSQSATSTVFFWKAPNLPFRMAETAASKPSPHYSLVLPTLPTSRPVPSLVHGGDKSPKRLRKLAMPFPHPKSNFKSLSSIPQELGLDIPQSLKLEAPKRELALPKPRSGYGTQLSTFDLPPRRCDLTNKSDRRPVSSQRSPEALEASQESAELCRPIFE